jgi:hypothetical protein
VSKGQAVHLFEATASCSGYPHSPRCHLLGKLLSCPQTRLDRECFTAPAPLLGAGISAALAIGSVLLCTKLLKWEAPI